MKIQQSADIASCSHSYEDLEAVLRKRFTETRLSYREIAAIVGWSHTQLWSFHKQNCKLQFDVMDRLALLFREPYILTNTITHFGGELNTTVESTVTAVRSALDIAISHGTSYRKIGRKTQISHEWVRCFHVKEATIDARKLLSLANQLGVPFELSNARCLANIDE